MTGATSARLLLATLLLLASPLKAEPLEYIGKLVRGIPVSSAVKVGKSVFVSGMPAFDGSGKLAVGDRTDEASYGQSSEHPEGCGH